MKRHWELDVEIPTDATRAPPSIGVPALAWSSSRPASDPTRWPSHPPKSTLGQGRRWVLSSHSSKVTSRVHLSSSPIPSCPSPLKVPLAAPAYTVEPALSATLACPSSSPSHIPTPHPPALTPKCPCSNSRSETLSSRLAPGLGRGGTVSCTPPSPCEPRARGAVQTLSIHSPSSCTGHLGGNIRWHAILLS